MTNIQQLKLTNAKPDRSPSPSERFRRKLVEAVDLQIEIANADLAGEAFNRTRQKWVKTDDGKERRTVPLAIRRWWWSDDKGTFYVTIKYGAQAIELAPGKSAIEIGALEDLPEKLGIVRKAIVAGELDSFAKHRVSPSGPNRTARMSKAAH